MPTPLFGEQEEDELFDPTISLTPEDVDPTVGQATPVANLVDTPTLADSENLQAAIHEEGGESLEDPNAPKEPVAPTEEAPEAPGAGDEGGGWSVFKDIALSPLRGTESFVADTWNFLDWVGGDILPDAPEERVFGEATSVVGGFLTEAMNLAWGLIPAVGVIGRFGKIGALNLTSRAQKVATRLGQTKNAFGIQLGRDVVAGAAVDFAFYDSAEERLSNMLTAIPALKNPVTEYLQQEEGEEEIEGRFKAALEGSAIGVAFDVVFQGVRAFKAMKRDRSAGGTPKSTQAAVKPYEEDIKRAMVDPRAEGLPPNPIDNAAAFNHETRSYYEANPATADHKAHLTDLCTHG